MVSAFFLLKSRADTYSPGDWTQSKFTTQTNSVHDFSWGQSDNFSGYASVSYITIDAPNYFHLRRRLLGGYYDGTLTTTIYAGNNSTAVDSIEVTGGQVISLQYRSASTAAGVGSATYVSENVFRTKCLSDRKFVQARIVFSHNVPNFTLQLKLKQANRVLSGTVYDGSSNNGLAGVKIKVGDYTTTTDSNGQYSFSLPFQNNFVLGSAEFSKTNYETQTKPLTETCVGTISQNVNLTSIPPPSVNLKANGSNGPITLDYDSSANLSWTSDNADNCEASDGWAGAKDTDGSETISGLKESKTFKLTCRGNGEASDSVVVTVKEAPPAPTPTPTPTPNPSPETPTPENPAPSDGGSPSDGSGYTYNPSAPGSSDTGNGDTGYNPSGSLAGPTAPKPSTISQATGNTSVKSTQKSVSKVNKILLYILIGLITLGGGFYLFLMYLRKKSTVSAPKPYIDMSQVHKEKPKDETDKKEPPVVKEPPTKKSEPFKPSSPLPSNMPSTTDKTPPPDDMSID